MEAVILVAIRLLVYLCVTMSIDYDEEENESIFVVAEGVLYRSSLLYYTVGYATLMLW